MKPQKKEIAERLGVVPSRVTALLKQGMPDHDLEAASSWFAANVKAVQRRGSSSTPDPQAASPGVPPLADDLPDTAPDYYTSRAKREAAEAALAELRLKEQQGELIRVEAVRAAWARALSNARDALIQIPHRLAGSLAAESDSQRVAVALESELRAVLIQLASSGNVERGAQ